MDNSYGGAYAPDPRLAEKQVQRDDLIRLCMALVLASITAFIAVSKLTFAPHITLLEVFMPGVAALTVFLLTAFFEARVGPAIMMMLRAVIMLFTIVFMLLAVMVAAVVYFSLMAMKPLVGLGKRFATFFGRWLGYEQRKVKTAYPS